MLDGPSVPVSTDIDKRYYDHLIGSVPPDSHSVPLILHCLLEQVSSSVNPQGGYSGEVRRSFGGLKLMIWGLFLC